MIAPRRALTLASRSPRRKALLEDAGFFVRCEVPDVEELTEIVGAPCELALVNAEAKLRVVAAREEDSVVIAADTIVVLDGEIFGKPTSLAHAAEMLGRLSGRVHEVVTGVAILHRRVGQHLCFHDVTRVRFRRLGATDIEAYLASIDPLDKAGAYAAQEDSGRIIEQIEGSFSNVVGLPMERTLEALRFFFAPIARND